MAVEIKRWWGILPLSFFVAHLIQLMHLGALVDLWWMCHVCNLAMALALFFRIRFFTGVCTLWLISGFPLWLLEVLATGEVLPTSIFSHCGALIVGVWLALKLGVPRGSWIWGTLWYILVQQISRLATPAELNINIAHEIRPEWQSIFSSYWLYWLTFALVAAVILWILESIIRFVTKSRRKEENYANHNPV